MARIPHAVFAASILTAAAASSAATKTYVAPGSSNFSAPLAWTPTGAPASTDSVVFGNAITANATITIDSGGSVAGTTVDTTHAYTIALAPGGPTVFSAGALNLAAGTLALAAGGSNTLRFSTLTIASSGAVLNLHDNGAIFDNDYPAPVTQTFIRNALLTGKITGDVTATRRIAYADATTVFQGYSSGTFAGQSVTTANGQPILLKQTLAGDANIDGIVNFDDLIRLAMNFNQPSIYEKTWASGDFNYDGIVNFDDLIPLAQNYTKNPSPLLSARAGGGEGFAADWALAQSLVPEPTTLTVLAALMPAAFLRRR